jgi:hypothetical protein
MSEKRADEYRRKAQECVASAQRAADPGDKINWLTMAESWQRLSEKAKGTPAIQVPPEMIVGQEPEIPN